MSHELSIPTPITIYVKPYVRKYVVARLADPERRILDEGSRKLWNTLQSKLRGRKLVSVVNDFDPASDDPTTKVVLLVIPKRGQEADVSYFSHRYVSGAMTKACLAEMNAWVDWYTNHLGWGIQNALQHFRTSYSITEEDHPLQTAARIYRFHKRPRRTLSRL